MRERNFVNFVQKIFTDSSFVINILVYIHVSHENSMARDLEIESVVLFFTVSTKLKIFETSKVQSYEFRYSRTSKSPTWVFSTLNSRGNGSFQPSPHKLTLVHADSMQVLSTNLTIYRSSTPSDLKNIRFASRKWEIVACGCRK